MIRNTLVRLRCAWNRAVRWIRLRTGRLVTVGPDPQVHDPAHDDAPRIGRALARADVELQPGDYRLLSPIAYGKRVLVLVPGVYVTYVLEHERDLFHPQVRS